jgi:hypothetical protein
MAICLQRISIGVSLSAVLTAAPSMIIACQLFRSVAGFLLPFLFSVLLITFGGVFAAARNRASLLPSHSILCFALPFVQA